MKQAFRILAIPVLLLALLVLLAGCRHKSGDRSVSTAPDTTPPATSLILTTEQATVTTTAETVLISETEPIGTPESTVPATQAEAFPEPETEAATEPEPTTAQPTEPKQTEPQPTEPKPTEPKPTEPVPTEPKPTEHVHRWSGWTQSKAPTCGAAGEDVRTCSCGAKETRTVAATGKHSWQETSATCTQDGAKTCMVCGAKESIPALGHAWVHTNEVGHWQNLITCRCGAQFSSEDEWYAHATASPDLDYADAHAGYELHEIWVVDSPAQDVCSRCGTVK